MAQLVGDVLTGEPGSDLVDMGQQLVRLQVEFGERAQGGTEAPHHGGDLDPVSDDLADDESDPGSGQFDHVEPVPARSHGQVQMRRLDGGQFRRTARQQMPLEGRGRVPLPCVARRVVDAEGSPGGDLHHQIEILLGVRLGPLRAVERDDTEHGIGYDEGHRHQRVDARGGECAGVLGQLGGQTPSVSSRETRRGVVSSRLRVKGVARGRVSRILSRSAACASGPFK